MLFGKEERNVIAGLIHSYCNWNLKGPAQSAVQCAKVGNYHCTADPSCSSRKGLIQNLALVTVQEIQPFTRACQVSVCVGVCHTVCVCVCVCACACACACVLVCKRACPRVVFLHKITKQKTPLLSFKDQKAFKSV